MKKSIRPPENWQDFESLCKKLFGEVWGCSYTIKKNGRLGQPQAGVDVYGKPKGETDYWGIQCKGKENYSDNKLTKNEIDAEILKALNFEPHLKVYVIATTAQKDVEIEKYIRLKDQESCRKRGFEILLYSWEDIADLIEEHRDTFNWYVNNLQFKEQFDVEIKIESKYRNTILKPKFLKKITNYKVKQEQTIRDLMNNHFDPVLLSQAHLSSFSGGIMGPKKKNHGWCKLIISIKNSGNKVIEDWKFWLNFSPLDVREVDDDFTSDIFTYKEAAKYRTTWAYEKEKQILFKPLNNAPLIQKDIKVFECFCIPQYDAIHVNVSWKLLARDFDLDGSSQFEIMPEYEISEKIIFVEDLSITRQDVEISDFVTIV